MKGLVKKRFNAFLIDISILGVLELFLLITLMLNINKSFLCIHSITTVIILCLFFCKDIINGQSVGKRIQKIRVVTQNGGAVSLQNIIARNVTALLQPIDVLYMINNDGKRLGDIICKTKVVDFSREVK